MARVQIFDYDRIAAVTLKGGVDVGTIPRGKSLEQLRWDGEQLVDLADLDHIWVVRANGVCTLHAIEVPGAQLVAMTYAQRRELTTDPDGTIRVEPEAERLERELAEAYIEMTRRITNAADKALDDYLAEYGEVERATFNKQLEEARALQADPNAPAPMLEAMVSARQDPEVPDKHSLAARVLVHEAGFTALSAHIIGQRQGKHTQLKALRYAGDLEGMRGIDLTYELPD